MPTAAVIRRATVGRVTSRALSTASSIPTAKLAARETGENHADQSVISGWTTWIISAL